MLKQAIDAGKAAAASQVLLDEAEGVSLGLMWDSRKADKFEVYLFLYSRMTAVGFILRFLPRNCNKQVDANVAS